MSGIQFICYVHPEPQGSAKGFPIRRANGKMGVSITTDNKKLKPFRHAITQVAMIALQEANATTPLAGKHVPVSLEINCYFAKPPSAPKKRDYPAVKPDADKLARAIFDALTGVLFADDAQVVQLKIGKYYGTPERVEVTMLALGTTEDHPVLSKTDEILRYIPF